MIKCNLPTELYVETAFENNVNKYEIELTENEFIVLYKLVSKDKFLNAPIDDAKYKESIANKLRKLDDTPLPAIKGKYC